MLLENKQNFFDKYKYLILVLVLVIVWFPVFFVPFLNEDYQILTFHKAAGIISTLEVFWQPDVMSPYWRPVTNFFRELIKVVAGFNPFLFKLNSLVAYIICSLLITFTLEKINFSWEYSLLGGLLFGVLPSHELQVAWIADNCEPLATIFLLLSFINYLNIDDRKGKKRKYIFLTITFFVLAILTKESAFTGALIPVIVFVFRNNFSKERLFRLFRDTLIGVGLIVISLLYRLIVLGSSPFSSRHFTGNGIINYIINFFIYIPLSFFPPEILESLANNLILSGLIACLFFLVIFLAFKKLKETKKAWYKVEILGVGWFIIFIIPALPTLMRWYSFTASVGIIWFLIAIIKKLVQSFRWKILLVASFILVITSFSIFDFTRMLKWIESGKKVENAITSLQKLNNNLTSDTLYVWCSPDKAEMIPMMKLGLQQTIQWALKNNVEVFSYLKVELNSFHHSKIDLISQSNNSLVFKLNNGRFLLTGGKSSSIIKPEVIYEDTGAVIYNIKTYLNKEKIPQSIARITFNRKIAADQIYFDGDKFIKIIY
jgi:energy-converting hydrogenase Eha subunit C